MLKIEYSLLALFTVGTLIGITFPIRETHPHLFLLAEVVSVALSIWILRLWLFINKPLKELNNALRLLKNNDFQSRLLPTPHPVVNQLVEVFNQIIDRIHKERLSQREQSYFLDQLIKATPQGIIILDHDEKIIQANPSALQYLEIDFDKIQSLGLKETNILLLDRLAEIPLNYPSEIQLSGGRKYRCFKSSFIFQGFPQQFIILQDSYLDDLKTEKQAYSKVIRMMSHEVNNSVGAINSYIDSLKYFPLADEDLKEDYDEALEVVKTRNDNMATFMKNFASVVKVPEPVLKEIDLKRSIDDIIRIYATTFEADDIHIVNEVNNAIVVKADETLIEQLFINILKNAKEALLESKNERVIKISTEGNVLSIWNSGPKIPEDVEQKLFTPFYSSKPTGQGIGLMICREVLVKHKWDFKLHSLHEGAQFDIYYK
ncbi:PAS domain-containing protein [Flammeovirga sp. MY04]|uniref:sensor histidine kinase n=1 Tax=Flammeovirga sp. MY04 TaxID=1191459 RepID=UPI00082505C1|nr:ATP-binding protein [Flammeovirga sp. MY04]ANQ48835.2 PAS domain-containing protein [Flammeovirga sp. MY04]